MKNEPDNPVCPECGSDDWDWTHNDNARCRHCGHQWIQPTESEDPRISEAEDKRTETDPDANRMADREADRWERNFWGD